MMSYMAKKLNLLAKRKRLHPLYSELRKQKVRVAALKHTVKKRTCWRRPIFMEHKSQCAWFTLVPKLRESDPEKFYNFFRMRPEDFDKLLGLVEGPLTKKSFRESICPGERLAIALRYYATGDSYRSLSYLFRVSDQVISNIVFETSVVIWEALQTSVFEPLTEETWLRVAAEFESMWQVPHTLGCIDSKLVYMKAPALSGSRFFSYKKRFSFNLMTVCDAKGKILVVDAGASGRRGDGNVYHYKLAELLRRKKLNIPPPCPFDGIEGNLPFMFLRDGAFERAMNMMNTFRGEFLSEPLRLFNYRFSRGRHCVENLYGLMTQRYEVFKGPMEGSKTTNRVVALACCSLHNFHLNEEESETRIRRPPQAYYDFIREDGKFIRGRWRNKNPEKEKAPLQRLQHNLEKARSTESCEELVGEDIRELLVDFYIEHPIPWQWKKADL